MIEDLYGIPARWLLLASPEPEPVPAGGGGPGPEPESTPEPDPSPEPSPEPEPSPAVPEPEPEPVVVKPDWRNRRIDKLTAQLNEARAKLASAPVPTPDPAGPAPVPPEEFESRVTAEAERRAGEAEFNRQCAEVAESGKTSFGDTEFNGRVVALVSTIDRSDPAEVSQYRSLIQAAIATGQAPKIIHTLGGDLNEASRVMALPPAQMGVELAKLALGLGDNSTRAPNPLRVPRGGSAAAAPHTAIDPTDPERADRLTTAEWMARREAQTKDTGGLRRTS
jgi:hypothetical protein